MKTLPLLLLALTACAKPHVRVGLRPAPQAEGVRLPEVVQRYHVGRLVDREDVMHEAHPFYRVEEAARWDLRPGDGSASTRWLDPSYAPVPVTDQLQAEMHRQQAATERVMEEAARLAKSYTELQLVLTELRSVTKDYPLLRARLEALERQDPATNIGRIP